ncbi:MAG: hypothetical protein AAF518_28805, partial [Spirochaetota bacterium]
QFLLVLLLLPMALFPFDVYLKDGSEILNVKLKFGEKEITGTTEKGETIPIPKKFIKRIVAVPVRWKEIKTEADRIRARLEMIQSLNQYTPVDLFSRPTLKVLKYENDSADFNYTEYVSGRLDETRVLRVGEYYFPDIKVKIVGINEQTVKIVAEGNGEIFSKITSVEEKDLDNAILEVAGGIFDIILNSRPRSYYAKRSFLFPGWGQYQKAIDKQHETKWKEVEYYKAFITPVLLLGSMSYAYTSYQTSLNNKSASNPLELISYYTVANRFDPASFLLVNSLNQLRRNNQSLSNTNLNLGIFAGLLYLFQGVDAYFSSTQIYEAEEEKKEETTGVSLYTIPEINSQKAIYNLQFYKRF